MERPSVFFPAAACPKARVDLEKYQVAVEDAGFGIAGDAKKADLVVIFTCGFIDDAKKESIADILAYCALKKQGSVRAIVVVGCLPEKYGLDLAKEVPQVDAFLGNTQLHTLPAVLRRLAAKQPVEKLAKSASFEGAAVQAAEPRRPRAAFEPWTRAVLICDGCNNACTYCAIPEMRGPLRSRTIESIVEEVNLLVGQGAKEIVLAGQDTASYGRDRGKGELGDLLRAVASRTQAHWIRLAYANPENLDGDVVRAIRDHANICHYIDMPIQHASPEVLARMGRPSGEITKHTIRSLRAAIPDIALRTSVIVGFPGETERDFNLLLDFLREVRFDMVGVFAFSPQAGTGAAGLASKVPHRIGEARLVEVVSLQDEIARAKANAAVGSCLEVLVERATARGARGRSQYDMAEVDRVIRLKNCAAPPGEFVRARLERYIGTYEFEAVCLDA
jgi:ribosomal protein S12 methylthiotransferase